MHLTQRQEEVARLMANGLNRSLIAETLGISVSSVDKSIRILKIKFGAANQIELGLRCSQYVAQTDDVLPRATTGPLRRADTPDARASGELPESFAAAPDFNTLFQALLTQLRPMGVTHATYSQIQKVGDRGIKHIATHWSFPKDVTFDMSIPPEENLAFKHALTNWDPMPLDLEELSRSNLYDFLPANIQRQNDVFRAAGLSRGVTYVLPGGHAAERLVLSVLFQNASQDTFNAFIADHLKPVHALLLQFRNAHFDMAKPTIRLARDDVTIMEHLCEGKPVSEIADLLGTSRRALDRTLVRLRAAFGVTTNAAAASAFTQDRLAPRLPF